MRTPFLICILLGLVGCSGSPDPARPNSLPSTAVWAGGADGGAWIDCHPIAKEPHAEYECTTYQESGVIWSSGHFIVAERRDNRYEYPAAVVFPQAPSRYEWYDGRQICVQEGRFLVPRGWIEYPFGDGHGKRERYEHGEVVESTDF